ncbi:GNAT family N-acetyltransferase [Nocardiopsis sp. MG754419]|uniref:GNAT family N-acetyltransferase n=1 Tax=Nocardiopsis sp. MG754419 TaxID=2259865 RepID=UPI001BAACA59|nr:GNAT family N-acetyltransferase [Nocardiopsis sp. MG754419]MBR8740143.1 GNAT family N-acetyltransferase [Nocardiopsis sp. MG754419]
MGPHPPQTTQAPAIRVARIDDPLARPLLDDLRREHTERDGVAEHREAAPRPDTDFAPPGGLLLLLVLGGRPVAGGAFRRHDVRAARIERVWTASDHRRRGYASLVLAALERAAAQAGYTRIHLTTGSRQAAARGLCLASGYRPRFDDHKGPETLGSLTFDKDLGRKDTGARTHPVPPPAEPPLEPHPCTGQFRRAHRSGETAR